MIKNGLEIDSSGNKFWYKNDKLHREDGPAIEYVSGHKHWFIEDMWHREDGPAIEWPNGDFYWFIDGKEIEVSSNEEFLRLVKLKAFI